MHMSLLKGEKGHPLYSELGAGHTYSCVYVLLHVQATSNIGCLNSVRMNVYSLCAGSPNIFSCLLWLRGRSIEGWCAFLFES